MGVKAADILFALALNLIHSAYSEHILSCNVNGLEPCPGENQICNQTSLQCVCLEGFVYVGDDCEPPHSADAHSDHRITAVVVTVFTLCLILSGLVLVIRKYNLVEYVRQKINLRRNNDVMYEDVMIGNDDPPLSP